MNPTLLTLVCLLTTLNFASSAPIGFRIRQIISAPGPQTGVRVQTPQDVAVIDGMEFHNVGDSGKQNATCLASNVECVAKRNAQLILNEQAATLSTTPLEKRTRRTKRIPQGNAGAEAAQAFAAGTSGGELPPAQNMSCLASDVDCVTKRSSEVAKKPAPAAKRWPQGFADAAAAFAARMNAPPITAQQNMSCLASDVDCVAKRSALLAKQPAPRAKRWPQFAGAAAAFAASMNAPATVAPQNMTCLASDVDCVVRRSQGTATVNPAADAVSARGVGD